MVASDYQINFTGAAAGSVTRLSDNTVSTFTTVPVQVEEASSTQQVFTNTASVATTSLEENTANNSNSGQVTVESTALAGLVYRDFNNNGVQDPGDSGIGGVSMTLNRTGGGTAVTFTVAVVVCVLVLGALVALAGQAWFGFDAAALQSAFSHW